MSHTDRNIFNASICDGRINEYNDLIEVGNSEQTTEFEIPNDNESFGKQTSYPLSIKSQKTK